MPPRSRGRSTPSSSAPRTRTAATAAPCCGCCRARYPTGAGEVAVTDEVAKTFKLHLGDRFDRDGHARTVVGLVENPTDLLDEFALAERSLVATERHDWLELGRAYLALDNAPAARVVLRRA